MCGIAGQLARDDVGDAGLVRRMTDAIAHRGPDGSGQWQDGPCVLGHRRLAIIDLSEAASQPMLNERPTTTWGNGEVIFDPKLLQTPDGQPLPLGTYSIGVVAYRFLPDGTTERLLTPDGADHISLGNLPFAP